jgi:DNA-binding MarR family transcriptional regulator
LSASRGARVEREETGKPSSEKSDYAVLERIMNIERDAMKHYTTESFTLTRSVGFMLTKARNLIIAEMDAALKDLDITTPQFGVLLAMQRGLAASPFELSKMLSVDTGLMTRMLDKLEAKGLLERSRSADDRRVVKLLLTGKGHEVAAEIPKIAPEVLNARLKKFTAAEFEELCRLLDKFIGE